MSALPILYSFRRCPYAIRARMAIARAGIEVELREVLLRDKPREMLAASPKGTVPVLVLPGGEVIDESIDVMHWALDHRDPEGWRRTGHARTDAALIAGNDGPFKARLDRYKYADRFPEHTREWYRVQAEPWLGDLNARLAKTPWLCGERRALADVALFPFLRQFAMVDRRWFDASPFAALRQWLDRQLADPLFASIMHKHPPWQPGQAAVTLSADD